MWYSKTPSPSRVLRNKWINYTTISTTKKTSHLKIIAQVFENRCYTCGFCYPDYHILSVVITAMLEFWLNAAANEILSTRCQKDSSVFTVLALNELRTTQVGGIGTNRAEFSFSLCCFQYVLCSISPNSSRWHQKLVSGALHSETHTSLWQSLLPFYFVSHLDHLLI